MNILLALIPEAVLAIGSLLLLLLAAFAPLCRKLAAAAASFTIILSVVMMYTITTPHQFYSLSNWDLSLKVLAAVPAVIIAYSVFVYPLKRYSIEFLALLLLSLIGSFVVISARDFLVLFVGMEIQALVGYILAAYNRHDPKSAEAGLKYFVLGALASCLGLLGISFIYGFTGSIDFYLVAEAIAINNNFALAAGSVFVLLSIFFKLSIAPLHMWTPDIYEGSPIQSVALFTSSTKIAIFGALVNLISIPFFILDYIPQLIEYAAIASVLIGAFGGLRQKNVKRLLGYSSIMNMGFVLAALVVNQVMVGLFYLVVYSLAAVGLLILLKAVDEEDSNISMTSLVTITRDSRIMAGCAAIYLFSMLGMPPFAGFFAKLYIFLSVIEYKKYWFIASLAVSSVVAAYYYLKLVRFMYFEQPPEVIHPSSLRSNHRLILPILLAIAALMFVLGFQVTI